MQIVLMLCPYAANHNDVMCGVYHTCMQVSWASLCNIDVPHYTYWPGIDAYQPLTTKINCFTSLGNNYPKCNENMPMMVLTA